MFGPVNLRRISALVPERAGRDRREARDVQQGPAQGDALVGASSQHTKVAGSVPGRGTYKE